MTSRTTSVLIILGTLLVGITIGAMATGALMNHRLDELEALRMQGGVQSYLKKGIQPTDPTQAERIQAAIEHVESRQLALRREMFSRHRVLFDSLRTELDLILTDAQKEQIRAMLARERDEFRQRRGRGDGPPPFAPDGDFRRRPRHRGDGPPPDSVRTEKPD